VYNNRTCRRLRSPRPRRPRGCRGCSPKVAMKFDLVDGAKNCSVPFFGGRYVYRTPS